MAYYSFGEKLLGYTALAFFAALMGAVIAVPSYMVKKWQCEEYAQVSSNYVVYTPYKCLQRRAGRWEIAP